MPPNDVIRCDDMKWFYIRKKGRLLKLGSHLILSFSPIIYYLVVNFALLSIVNNRSKISSM